MSVLEGCGISGMRVGTNTETFFVNTKALPSPLTLHRQFQILGAHPGDKQEERVLFGLLFFFFFIATSIKLFNLTGFSNMPEMLLSLHLQAVNYSIPQVFHSQVQQIKALLSLNLGQIMYS